MFLLWDFEEMTPNELRNKFNDEFGLDKWPEIYEVDHETYANVCQELFNSKEPHTIVASYISMINITIGPNKGIFFKNVELILK